MGMKLYLFLKKQERYQIKNLVEQRKRKKTLSAKLEIEGINKDQKKKNRNGDQRMNRKDQ